MKKQKKAQSTVLERIQAISWQKMFFICIISAVIFRLLVSVIFPSYQIDMGGYKAWSIRLAVSSFSKFYDSGLHVVYGPFYLYFLWITGSIVSAFNLFDLPHEFLIKIWAVASDFIGAILIYKIAKRHSKEKLGAILAAIYVLNPGIFFNSSVWGQFDSIPATMMLGTVYLFELKKPVHAIALYTLSIIAKPQSIFLAPIIICMFFLQFDWSQLSLYLKEKKKSQTKSFVKSFVIKTVSSLAGGIVVYILTILPFTGKRSFLWLISHYINSGGDYPYATANAFNIWTIFGAQTITDNHLFLDITYYKWGLLMLAATAIFSIWYLIKNKNNPFALYYSSYIMLFGSFMLFTRMHERYLFPALIFITVCILWDLRLIIPTVIVSACRFANELYVYYCGNYGNPWVTPTDIFSHVIAWLTLIGFGYSIYYCFNLKGKKSQKTKTVVSTT